MKLRKLYNIFMYLLVGIAGLCLIGCSKPVFSEQDFGVALSPTITNVPTITPTIAPTNTPTPTLTNTPTPSPTVTPTPTSTPTPTPSPTPTEVPVYDQILRFEAENGPNPDIPVKAALLVNISEHKVLYADKATEAIYPASITKLMTALTPRKYYPLSEYLHLL